MGAVTPAADQGLAAQALAEMTRQHMAAAEAAARAAETAQRQAEAMRKQS